MRPILLKTFDGGNKWGVRTFGNLDEEEEINYRFQKVRTRRAPYVHAVAKGTARAHVECLVTLDVLLSYDIGSPHSCDTDRDQLHF